MENIPLWKENAPHFDPSFNQDPPYLVPMLTGQKGRGAVIVCPGGGYTMKAAHEGVPIAESINRCGVNAFVLEYRVAPYKYPVPLLDAQRAIRLVRYHAPAWDIDPNHIAIMGFSAGGHLSSMAATRYDAGIEGDDDPINRVSCRPDGFGPCYGANNFKLFFGTGGAGDLLGKERATLEDARYATPEYNITDNTPPAFIWHTAQDDVVLVEHSIGLAQRLFDRCIPCALHIFPFGGHGIGLAADNKQASAWPDLFNTWLEDMGY